MGASHLNFNPVSLEILKAPRDKAIAAIADTSNGGFGSRIKATLKSISGDGLFGASCNCASGCCAPACIVVEAAILPVANFSIYSALPRFEAVAGMSPASLLEPPNTFA